MVRTRLKLTLALLAIFGIAAVYFAITNNDGTVIEYTGRSFNRDGIPLVVTYGYNNKQSTMITKTVQSPWSEKVTTNDRVTYVNLKVTAPSAYPRIQCIATSNGKHTTHSPRVSDYGNVDCSGTVFIG